MDASASAPETAAGMHVLRLLDDATGAEVLTLGLRELVLRRVWRLERRERSSWLGLRSELAIARGAQRAPVLAPLMQLDAALGAAVGPETVALPKAVKRLVKGPAGRGDALLAQVRADLERRGLVRREERRVLRVVPRRRLVATPEGERIAADSWTREEALRAALAADPGRAAEAVAAAGPLALLVAPELLAELDEEVRRRLDRVDASGGDPSWAYVDASDPEIGAAVDAGGGGDGGGGDGGGDGGG